MFEGLQQIKQSYQLKRHRVHKFEPRVRFNFELGPYTLRTAESTDDLIASFRLRDEVFNREFRGLTRHSLDFDKYDSIFDHLIILHGKELVGTYRLRADNDFALSYTAEEFNMLPGLGKPGPFLELGRACIRQDHRRGIVISLLWRGIAEYMNQVGAETLFGCSSVKINQARDAALLFKYLQEEKLVENVLLVPTRKYVMKNFDLWLEIFSKELDPILREEAQSLIPALLKSYIKLGAKISAFPAFDKSFDCIDLLTTLRRADLSEQTERKFKVK